MVPVAAVVATLHRLAYNFGAGPDDNKHKEFPMGKEQIMIKELEHLQRHRSTKPPHINPT